MTNRRDPYSPPQTKLSDSEVAENRRWKLLTVWCLLVLTVATFLSFVVYGNHGGLRPLGVTIGYLIGNVFAFPLIVLAWSQFWKKHRNARSRVKAVLYPAYLVLLAQGASFFQLLGEIARKAG